MDCTDIVISMARGEQFRVLDSYTRDRGTPRPDSFYGGQESLVAAAGQEADGVTYIKWRKPIKDGDTADHEISDELMHVIWAFGQIYPYSTDSGLQSETTANDRFYKPDELKYHGLNNRGATMINFFDHDVGLSGAGAVVISLTLLCLCAVAVLLL